MTFSKTKCEAFFKTSFSFSSLCSNHFINNVLNQALHSMRTQLFIYSPQVLFQKVLAKLFYINVKKDSVCYLIRLQLLNNNFCSAGHRSFHSFSFSVISSPLVIQSAVSEPFCCSKWLRKGVCLL